MRDQPIIRRLIALAGSPDAGARVRALRSELDIDHLRFLQTEVARLIRTSPPDALALARIVSIASRVVGGPAAAAVSERALADAHFLAGKLRRALQHYDAAVEGYRESGEQGEMARTLVGRMSLLTVLGKDKEAQRDAKVIRPILTRLDDRAYLAKFHMNRGNRFVARDDFPRALAEYDKARLFFEQTGEDDAAIVGLDQNRAAVLTYLDRFEEALTIYETSRKAAREGGFLALDAQITHNIGHLHVLSSRHHEALQLLGEARDAFEKIPDPVQIAKCDLNRSDVYLRLRMSEEAATIADGAAAVFLKNRLRYDGGLALVIAGRAHSDLGRGDEAIRRFRRARRLFEGENLSLRAGLAALRTAEHLCPCKRLWLY